MKQIQYFRIRTEHRRIHVSDLRNSRTKAQTDHHHWLDFTEAGLEVSERARLTRDERRRNGLSEHKKSDPNQATVPIVGLCLIVASVPELFRNA